MKTPSRYHFTHTRTAKIKRLTCVGKERELRHCLNSLEVSYNVKHPITISSSNTTRRYLLKRNENLHPQKDPQKCVAALFAMASNWKYSIYLTQMSTDGLLSLIWNSTTAKQTYQAGQTTSGTLGPSGGRRAPGTFVEMNVFYMWIEMVVQQMYIHFSKFKLH